MSPIVVIAALTVSAAMGYWWWSRKTPVETRPRVPQARASKAAHASKATPRSAKATLVSQRFAGVKIRVGHTACAAARALHDQHFLIGEAPSLPLAKCSEAKCRCSFQRLSDRRIDTRRWADEGIGAVLYSAEERRAVPDRRD